MTSRQISRRTLLAIVGLGGAEALLAACSRSADSQTVVTSTSTSVVDAPPVAVSGPATPSASAVVPTTAAASGAPTSGPESSGTAASSTAPTSPTGAPVHVRLYESDGQTYGVGMPIIVYLSKKITDAKPFARATTVTVNGTAAAGAWYFQKSAIYADYPLEAHYRLEDYWPAHAAISLDLPSRVCPPAPVWCSTTA